MPTFVVPEGSASTNFWSTRDPGSTKSLGETSRKSDRKATTGQNPAPRRSQQSDAGTIQAAQQLPMLQPQLRLPQRYGTDSIVTIDNDKKTRARRLGRRVTRFFIDPCTRSLGPSSKAIGQVDSPSSFPSFHYDARLSAVFAQKQCESRGQAIHNCVSGEMHFTAGSLAASSPAPMAKMQFSQVTYEDGDSVANYSTPGKYEAGQRDLNVIMVTPTKYDDRVNMQILPLSRFSGTHIPSPTGSRRLHITDSFSSIDTMSDHGYIDSRNGGPPIWRLHRGTNVHREQLAIMHMVAAAKARQQDRQGAEDSGSDWAEAPVQWGHNAEDLDKLPPGDKQIALKLVNTPAGKRDGFVLDKHTPTPPRQATPERTPMDTDNVSRDWRVQPEQPDSATSSHKPSPVTIASDDDRDVDPPRPPDRARRASRMPRPFPSVIYSPSTYSRPPLRAPDAFGAAQHEGMREILLPGATIHDISAPLANGLDNWREKRQRVDFHHQHANTDPVVAVPERPGFERRVPLYPEHLHTGKMGSTSQLPTPLLWPVEGGAGTERDAQEEAASQAFFGSGTEQLLALVRPLEAERDELSVRQTALLAQLEHWHEMTRKSRSAHDSLQARTDAEKQKLSNESKALVEDNAELKMQLASRAAEVEYLSGLLGKRDTQIKGLRKQVGGQLGEVFGSDE